MKGAFTGAVRDNAGRIASCAGGTLFLDEIGDLPPLLQPKLLRFIQDHEYEPVGESVVRRADVRVLAATNVDLEAAVQGRSFRGVFLPAERGATAHSAAAGEATGHCAAGGAVFGGVLAGRRTSIWGGVLRSGAGRCWSNGGRDLTGVAWECGERGGYFARRGRWIWSIWDCNRRRSRCRRRWGGDSRWRRWSRRIFGTD